MPMRFWILCLLLVLPTAILAQNEETPTDPPAQPVETPEEPAADTGTDESEPTPDPEPVEPADTSSETESSDDESDAEDTEASAPEPTESEPEAPTEPDEPAEPDDPPVALHPYFGDTSISWQNFVHGSVGIGFTNIRFDVFTQLLVRWHFRWSKLKVYLNFTFNFDQNVSLRALDWNSPKSWLAWIHRITWDRPSFSPNKIADPLYVGIGRINLYTFGTGAVINRYTNTLQEPVIHKRGLQVDFQWEYKFGAQLFVNDLEDFGITAARAFIMPLRFTPLASTRRERGQPESEARPMFYEPLTRTEIGAFFVYERIGNQVDSVWFDRDFVPAGDLAPNPVLAFNPNGGFPGSPSPEIRHRSADWVHSEAASASPLQQLYYAPRCGPTDPQPCDRFTDNLNEAYWGDVSNVSDQFVANWGLDLTIPFLNTEWADLSAQVTYVNQDLRTHGLHVGLTGQILPQPFSFDFRAEAAFTLGSFDDRNHFYIPRFHDTFYDVTKAWLTVWQNALSQHPSRGDSTPWKWYFEIGKTLWEKDDGFLRVGFSMEHWVGIPQFELDENGRPANGTTIWNPFIARSVTDAGRFPNQDMNISVWMELDDIIPRVVLRLIYDKYDVDDFQDFFREEAINTRTLIQVGYRIAEFVEILITYQKGFYFGMESWDWICADAGGPIATLDERCNHRPSSVANGGEFANEIPLLIPDKNQSFTLETRITF